MDRMEWAKLIGIAVLLIAAVALAIWQAVYFINNCANVPVADMPGICIALLRGGK